MKNVEIITTGSEVISGITLDTNSHYISKKISINYGYAVKYKTTVPDDFELIEKSLMLALKRADIVFVLGGLGPTNDDITMEVISKVIGKKLILSDIGIECINKYFGDKNNDLKINKVAFIPEDAVPLKNDVGTAVGAFINENEKIIIVLPGPPNELIPMFDNYVLPKLENNLKKEIVFIKTIGIGEVLLQEKLKDIILKYDVNIYLKDYHTMLIVKSDNVNEMFNILESILNSIKEYIFVIISENEEYSKLKEVFYSKRDLSIEQVVKIYLERKNLTVSFCESLTGGLISSRLVRVPGISKYFLGSIVAYNTIIKKSIGIDENVIKNGVVSSECAKEMAKTANEILKSDITISITGVAGPDKQDGKDVGECYIGFYNSVTKKSFEKYIKINGDRNLIREKSSVIVLKILLDNLILN